MSVLEELGMSDEEWRQIEPAEQQRLVNKMAKIQANKLLASQAMMEDDDRDIRRRVKSVEQNLLGQDANSCTDEPYTDESGEDVRITVLGDVNGNEAISMLSQKSDANVGNTVVERPTPKRSPFRWMIPLAYIAGGAAIAFGAASYFANKNQDYDPSRYDIAAVPYFPEENP